MAIEIMKSNSQCNHTSDWQNQTSMITERIGWHKVLLPINHNYDKILKQSRDLTFRRVKFTPCHV